MLTYFRKNCIFEEKNVFEHCEEFDRKQYYQKKKNLC